MPDETPDDSTDDQVESASDDEPSVDGETVDVVVVGGGPAGSAAAVFAGRYGLDTVVFDRGNSALRRCAYLENYPGFPGGVDVDVFHDLLHEHVAEMGARRVAELVDAVERVPASADADEPADAPRFRVRTQAGTTVRTPDVVAAAWYDGSYLRPLEADAEGELFTEHEHHGEVEERFDPEYADHDGRTPIDGLYVASPSGARSAQAVVAAGNGAHVARSLIEDRRRERGFSGHVAPEYDWLRRDSEYSGEWADRDRWREFFENELDDDHGLDDDELVALREEYVEEAFETRLTEAEATERAGDGLARFVDVAGVDRVVESVGVDRVVDAVGAERVLDAVDDDVLRAHLDDAGETPGATDGRDAGETTGVSE